VSLWLQLLLGLLLVAWTAFFVAAEYAFIAARTTRMRELAGQGNRRAARVVAIQENPTRYIASIQVAITFAGLALGAVGEPAVRQLAGDVLESLPVASSQVLATVLSVTAGFAIIIAITVVLGEIVPKAFALVRTEAVALAAAGPIRVFTTIVHPFVWILERLSSAALHLFSLRDDIHLGRGHTEEELRMILAASREEGILEADESAMLDRVLGFADTEVRQVMVPRPDVVLLPLAATVAEATERAAAHPYTRYPVCGDTPDDIRGVIHIRQLFAATLSGARDGGIRDLVRDVQQVPQTRRLNALLHDFLRTKSHLAVVIDEYGSLSGVVTLEDLIEEIMGEIEDEFDVPAREIEYDGVDGAEVAGAMTLARFNDVFGTDLDDADVTTVGGAVFGALGCAPAVGDVVDLQGLRVEVTGMEGSRIARVRVSSGLAHD